MYFVEERIGTILRQLKLLRIRKTEELSSWQYKKGFFLHPQEAENDAEPWTDFDCKTMRWYARYAGTDRFEGKFEGHAGDFRGISGTHYWFKTELTVPETYNGEPLWMKISTQLEDWDDGKNPQFLVFANGEPIQGADMNHRDILLRKKAVAGEKIRLDVQAYTGTLHMEFSFLTKLYTADEKINRLYYDLLVPYEAFSRMDKDDKTYLDIRTALNNAVNLIDMREPFSKAFYESVEEADAFIGRELYEKTGGCKDVIATCIGHTHIDIGWWWTVEQTREKAARSFSTVLKLMEEYPSYKFMSSQPILYEFVKERYPELYAGIKERVKEGRWEPEGGMWLEADCNLTGGESLIRQFVYGKRFFKEEFGKDNKILWLPDVFGYSGALPQIMKGCGIDYFMTTKLAWNQINKIPNDTFIWRGIDGSEVLTHLITTVTMNQDPKKNFFTTYNGMLHPNTIMGGWERYQNKEINNDILVCFGYGDGGGGPTREMLETSARMERGVKGIPFVRQEGARTYFDELNERVKDNPRLDIWEGELYFEYHRGTYTSIASVKRGNRKSEMIMADMELFGVLSKDYPGEADFRLWKDIVLRNQFHDILPGSAIAEVYEVAEKEYRQLAREAGAIIDDRAKRLAGSGDGVTVFNTLGFERDDIVNLGELDCTGLMDADGRIYPVQKTEDGSIAYIKGMPSKGYMSLSRCEAAGEAAFKRADDYSLETPFYSVRLDEKGRISSLYDKENERETVKPGEVINRLRLYEDKPARYDDWDIDMYYTEKSWDVDELAHMEWTDEGPVSVTLKLCYLCGKSVINQKIRFYANTRRIDFENDIDWHMHQHLLKAEFPVDIHSDEATFEIQFGNVKRKVHKNTSWDKARFESCAQKWMDFSEGHYGVSLLNDCKYGHSVLNGVMGLTLIKCGVDPNPNADNGRHTFTYSLYPHAEGWQQAKTVNEAYKLNSAVYTVLAGDGKKRLSFAGTDKPNVILETVKQAENGDGIVLRLYECENAKTGAFVTLPEGVKEAYTANMLEEKQSRLPIENGRVKLDFHAFEIKTLLLK